MHWKRAAILQTFWEKKIRAGQRWPLETRNLSAICVLCWSKFFNLGVSLDGQWKGIVTKRWTPLLLLLFSAQPQPFFYSPLLPLREKGAMNMFFFFLKRRRRRWGWATRHEMADYLNLVWAFGPRSWTGALEKYKAALIVGRRTKSILQIPLLFQHRRECHSGRIMVLIAA